MNIDELFQVTVFTKLSAVSIPDIAITLLLASALGYFVHFMYKKTYAGVMYSRAFSNSLIALSCITSLLILTISSNVVLTLGTIGALSIIRFRTAVKEPSDLVYLFWAIAGGMILGAGMITVAVIGSFVIALVLFLCARGKAHDTPYMLVLQLSDGEAESAALALVKKSARQLSVKSKSVTADLVELTLEVRVNADAETRFVNEISALGGVINATLVAFNGEYVS